MSNQTLPAVQQSEPANWVNCAKIHFMSITFDAFDQRPLERHLWCFIFYFFIFFAAESCRADASAPARCAQLCSLWLFTACVRLCSSGAPTWPLVASRCSLTPPICVITRRRSFIVPFSWIVAKCGGRHYHLGLSGRPAPYAAVHWLGSVQRQGGGVKQKVPCAHKCDHVQGSWWKKMPPLE